MKNLSAKIKQSLFINRKLLMLLLFAVSWGCKDNNPGKAHPPELWYIGYETIKGEMADSLLVINLGYKDDDGDIGLNPYDTFPPYNLGSPYQYNLNVTFFELKDGKEEIIAVDPSNPNHQRIPDLRPTGRNKRIEGTIEISFPVGLNALYQDTIKGYFKLTDRNLMSSAEISSDLIYLDQ